MDEEGDSGGENRMGEDGDPRKARDWAKEASGRNAGRRWRGEEGRLERGRERGARRGVRVTLCGDGAGE